MARKTTKAEVITFKADASLLEALRAVPNRSEFIRQALLGALENACPVCGGTGMLSPNQKRHWHEFAAEHSVKQCGECLEYRLVCDRGPERG